MIANSSLHFFRSLLKALECSNRTAGGAGEKVGPKTALENQVSFSTMSSQPVPFNWQQVDERLSSIMQGKVSAEIRELITDDVGHIHFQNMHNSNSITVPSQRLRMQLLRSDECAARLYEGYCEIWRTQRRHLSPEFLRAIARHAISVLVSARKGAVADEFRREHQRTGSPHASWLQSAMDGFARDMILLLHKWEQASESDARTVQYMLESGPGGLAITRAAWEVITAKARIRTLEAGIASIEARIKMAESALNGMSMSETPPYRKASVEQSLSRLKDERKELRSGLDDWQVRLKAAFRDADEVERTTGADSGTVAREMPDEGDLETAATPGEKPRGSTQPVQAALNDLTETRNEPWQVYTSPLKRAIMALLISKPDRSDLDICHELDIDGAPLPDAWRMGDISFFESAYRDSRLRPRIQTMISKIRADLRRKRIIA